MEAQHKGYKPYLSGVLLGQLALGRTVAITKADRGRGQTVEDRTGSTSCFHLIGEMNHRDDYIK